MVISMVFTMDIIYDKEVNFQNKYGQFISYVFCLVYSQVRGLFHFLLNIVLQIKAKNQLRVNGVSIGMYYGTMAFPFMIIHFCK